MWAIIRKYLDKALCRNASAQRWMDVLRTYTRALLVGKVGTGIEETGGISTTVVVTPTEKRFRVATFR